MNCKNCKTFYCPEHGFNFEKQCNRYTPPTNADRIRAMSDEELAAFMFNANGCPMWVSDYSCKEDKGCHGAKGACWLDWLKQEATP